MRIGFDNDKYIRTQSEHIRKRLSQFGGKLYLEFGGKLFDDNHAARVLPGFKPDSKLQMLLELKDEAEIVIAVSAKAIEQKKLRRDLNISYDKEVLRLIDLFRSVGLFVGSVVITQYDGQRTADTFKEKLQKLIRPTIGWSLGAGTVSGVMGGLFGMQGPPVVLYLINSESDKNHYMGMIQTYAVATNVIMLAVRAYNGYLTPAVGSAYIYSLGGLAVGVIAGNLAFRLLSDRVFTYIVYAYIGISGLIILFTS